MLQKEIFTLALNITEPWFIETVDFDLSSGRLHIFVDFKKGSVFSVTNTEGDILEGTAYDTVTKTWRHLNFFQHECYITARVPRVKNDSGKISRVTPPWEGKMNGFTLLFEALLLQLISVMPVLKVQKLTGVDDEKLWDMVHRYIREAITNLDLSELREFGLDETSLKKGHDYISLFVDMYKNKIVFITHGRDYSILEEFAQFMKEHNAEPEQITDVSIDMSKSFIKGVNENFENANISFDKFHLIMNLNKAVNSVRIEESKSNPLLKGARFAVLKNSSNLTAKQRDKLDELRLSKLNIKTIRAMNIRMAFQDILNASEEDFEDNFKRWYFWATHSKLEPIIKVAKSLKKHYQGIKNAVYTKLNNGILEGINSLIQATKAKARGYKRSRYLIAIVYLIAGDIDLQNLNSHYRTL